jgi:hypothetical protein
MSTSKQPQDDSQCTPVGEPRRVICDRWGPDDSQEDQEQAQLAFERRSEEAAQLAGSPTGQEVGADSQPASPAQTEENRDKASAQAEPAQTAMQPSTQEVGNIPAVQGSEPPADAAMHARTRAHDVVQRLQREGRWAEQIECERDEMMALAKRQGGMDRIQAQLWVYAELDRLYPPLTPALTPHECTKANATMSCQNAGTGEAGQTQPVPDSGSIQGLSTIPPDWPSLPSNAPLHEEIGWVQANRLRIVTEQPGKATVVDLGRALHPAPSWAALGWLETSIRSYAKYVDVASKATASDEGEAGVMRRERMAVEGVQALLEEMSEAVLTCPHCGKPL